MPELELSTLGTALRSRRKALRIPSAELARRIGVSPTYVWLIEQAKPRSSGEPSRPGEELLRRWAQTLGMDDEETRRMMELAGYFEVDLDMPFTSRTSARAMYRAKPSMEGQPDSSEDREYEEGSGMLESMLDVGLADDSINARTRVWRRSEAETVSVEQELIERMRRLLRDASANGHEEEVRWLLDYYLRWLRFALEHEFGR